MAPIRVKQATDLGSTLEMHFGAEASLVSIVP